MSNETEPTPSPTPEPAPAPAPAPTPEPTPAPPPPAPEPFAFDKLTLPEGFTVDDELSKSFTDIMNDPKLTPIERGQKLVDLQQTIALKADEAGTKAWIDTQAQWQEQARADPVIGGDKLEPALGAIAQLIDSQGEQAAAIRQIMDLTGAGNHPVMIRFLSTIAKELSEGGPVPSNPPTNQQSLAQKMYPSMKS